MQIQSRYVSASGAQATTFTVKVAFPPAISIPPQTKREFATRHEAETWLEGIKHALCERYCCSERVLVRKGFHFLVVISG